ncbi:MAG: hypothetical protein WBD71_15005, partial [Xanthobacteraceae bacterium]
EESELTARQNLYLASVSLIEDLGGGWDASLLPDQSQLLKDFTFTPQLESNKPLAVELMPTIQSPSNPPAAPAGPPQ